MFIIVKNLRRNGKRVLINIDNIERVVEDYAYNDTFATRIEMKSQHDHIMVLESFDEILKMISKEVKKKKKLNRFDLMDL